MAIEEQYRLQVVKECKNGELIYPPNIPSDRSNAATFVLVVLVIALWAFSAYTARTYGVIEKLKYSYYYLIFNMLVILICNFLWRLCHLFEELNHVHARYDDSIAAVFKTTFQYNIPSIVIIVICILSVVVHLLDIGNELKYLWDRQPTTYFSSLACAILLSSLIDISESKLDTMLRLPKLNGLDYGSSMAYSYFYGYLNIILPSSGTENKGIYEKIEQYEANEKVTVPVKKMFILIPTSLRIPPDLKEASYTWMEKTKNLESVILDRAAVNRRTYHNTVYKIHPDGIGSRNIPVYVVVEGATPLLTFHEVLQHSGADSTSYNDFRKEIVGSFYRTLRNIIKSKPECRDVVELVYYEDYDPYGQRVNVAEILLRIIQPIQTPSCS